MTYTEKAEKIKSDFIKAMFNISVTSIENEIPPYIFKISNEKLNTLTEVKIADLVEAKSIIKLLLDIDDIEKIINNVSYSSTKQLYLRVEFNI